MDGAKIQFSPAEMELMNNADLILTKNKVLYKVKATLEQLQQEMLEFAYKNAVIYSYPHFDSTPKISKGENYLGLPYIVLDYPRQFDSQNIFAIRTMFWWGHFFSVTLHVAGNYKDEIVLRIEENYDLLAKHQYYISINEDPWQHHFEEDNYVLIKSIEKETFQSYCRQFEHVKIAAQFPLWDANFITEDLLEHWRMLTEICNS